MENSTIKQLTFHAAATAIFTLGLAAAVHAQARTGTYEPNEAGTIRRVPEKGPTTGASYDVGAYPTFRPQLAPGEGSREVNIYCNICHTPRYITMQPALPAGTWADEVNKMVKTYGAPIPEDTVQKIIGYLQSNYTPETRKR